MNTIPTTDRSNEPQAEPCELASFDFVLRVRAERVPPGIEPRHIREYIAALVEDRLPCLHEDILERMPDIQATILGPRLTDAPQGLPCALCGGFGYHLDHAETPCACKAKEQAA